MFNLIVGLFSICVCIQLIACGLLNRKMGIFLFLLNFGVGIMNILIYLK